MLSAIGKIDTPLPASDAVVIGLLMLIVVYGGTLWKVAVHAETVLHESAHVLTGIAAGRRIRSVTINSDGGGGTVMVPDSGFGFGVAAFVGYIGSSAAGLIAAGLISTGHMVAVLWLGLLLFAFMLLMVRNFFGGIVILTCGALLYLVVRYTTAGVQVAVAYGVTWFLLLSGTRVAFRAASRPEDVADAGILAGMTFLWRSAWCFLWLAGAIAALVAGAIILTHPLPRDQNRATKARATVRIRVRGLPSPRQERAWRSLPRRTDRPDLCGGRTCRKVTAWRAGGSFVPSSRDVSFPSCAGLLGLVCGRTW